MTDHALPDVLSLVSATRPGGPSKHERGFLDFRIGRRRLSSLVRDFDAVGVLGSVGGKVERHFARQLLLREPAAFASGRLPLYICAECGDLGCAGVAVRVTRLGERVTWSDFAAESYSGAGPRLQARSANLGERARSWGHPSTIIAEFVAPPIKRRSVPPDRGKTPLGSSNAFPSSTREVRDLDWGHAHGASDLCFRACCSR